VETFEILIIPGALASAIFIKGKKKMNENIFENWNKN